VPRAIHTEAYRVRPGQRVKLDKFPTQVAPIYKDRADARRRLAEHVQRLSELQNLLYASNRYSLLLIFQAMDAAGKDSAIKHVMSGVNPQGCQVYSFKHPSAEELDHDFLWSAYRKLPERGRIGIFNRSYYEEVLIVRVHPHILKSQNIPEELLDEETVWDQRYESIRAMERHLHRNGTRIVKFFLHISREEQRRRFLKRIDEPEKNWKFGSADIDERQFWEQYMRAYEACLEATSTAHAPWYVIPADDKSTAQLLISQVILDTLGRLKMAYPRPTPERRRELQEIRKRLLAERP
jgi:PPK2 family polyphosphate:nucleotide phosphotransferase